MITICQIGSGTAAQLIGNEIRWRIRLQLPRSHLTERKLSLSALTTVNMPGPSTSSGRRSMTHDCFGTTTRVRMCRVSGMAVNCRHVPSA